MTRILVTGLTGQVGGALVEALRPAGAVVAANRAALDLARPEEIAAALVRLAPELIINPAAYTAVDRAEDERNLAFRVNGEAPGVIARWAAARAVPLIHFSTDYVFDGSGARPWRENDRTGPLSAYGASKLAGEEAVRAAGGAHLIIRTSWVYGATGTNFLRSIVRLARERRELRVVADQFGAPTSARLIAAAVAGIVGKGGTIKGGAIKAGASNGGAPLAERFAASGGLVNVAASGVTSWHGFAAAIVDGLKRRGVALAAENVVPIRTEDYPTKARRPANSRFDLSRLSRVFGIETPLWDAALATEIDRLADEFAHSP